MGVGNSRISHRDQIYFAGEVHALGEQIPESSHDGEFMVENKEGLLLISINL